MLCLLLGLHQWEKFPKVGLHHEERFLGSVKALGYKGAGCYEGPPMGSLTVYNLNFYYKFRFIRVNYYIDGRGTTNYST